MKTIKLFSSARSFFGQVLLVALLSSPFLSQAQNSVQALTAANAQSVAAIQDLQFGDAPKLYLQENSQLGTTQGTVNMVCSQAAFYSSQLLGLSINYDSVQLLQVRIAPEDNIGTLSLDAAAIQPFSGLQYLLISAYQELSTAAVVQMTANLPATANLLIVYEQLKDN